MNNKIATERVSLKSYVFGFVLSIVFTLVAYFIVEEHVVSNHVVFSHALIIPIILSLAVVQFFVQLFFFLYLGNESKPRWKLIVLLSFISIILIIIVGSLWIMHNLSYNMTPTDMSTYMIEEEGMQK